MRVKTRVYDDTSENIISELLELGNAPETQDSHVILDQIVHKVAQIMESDVCSLYLINSKSKEVVLVATEGLNKEAVGKVKLGLGEGLVGKTIEWLKPVSVAAAKKSKKYKYIPETGEEKYASFLSVPLLYNRHAIGVLVIQHIKPIHYSKRSVNLLMTLSIPIVNVIEKTKLMGAFDQRRSTKGILESIGASQVSKRSSTLFDGVPASTGIAIGKIRIISREPIQRVIPDEKVLHADVEKMRLLEAIRWVEEEILAVQKKARSRFGTEELAIFDAYKMVLESSVFKDQIIAEIDAGKSALAAVDIIISTYTDELLKAEDEYIRERAYDIQDIGRKISDRLIYGSDLPSTMQDFGENCILFSDYWSISDFVEMDLDKTIGLLASGGGASSHVALLAQSLGIPAIFGLNYLKENIHHDDQVIMDGSSGVVIVNPAEEVLETYRREMKDEALAYKKYHASAAKPALLKLGHRVIMGANIGMIAHIRPALDNGAEEIGLYRTEFPFLIRRNLPTEEEQTILYKKVIQTMGKKTVVIRTLDIGGDKYLPYINLPEEENPCLGWRSIRISLDREDLFRIQLRALLKASNFGRIKLLFPMITSVEEIIKVKEIYRDVQKELKSEGVPFTRNIPLGIMIEVPSAVQMASALIKEVDFFSIGTNDLIQYTLAVDRNNAKVAKLYNPMHPAVLRSLSQTVEAAHAAGKKVGICGEMASQPLGVLFLCGIKIDSLSMSSPSIAKIKSLINRVSYRDLRKLSETVLKKSTNNDVMEVMKEFISNHGLKEYFISRGKSSF